MTEASRSAAAFDSLVDVVLEDVEAAIRRQEDRAVNEARGLVESAEEHVDELERAARELGRVRGQAAEETFQREADAEIREVLRGAFERLFDRFVLRVKTALEGLRETSRYADALLNWQTVLELNKPETLRFLRAAGATSSDPRAVRALESLVIDNYAMRLYDEVERAKIGLSSELF